MPRKYTKKPKRVVKKTTKGRKYKDNVQYIKRHTTISNFNDSVPATTVKIAVSVGAMPISNGYMTPQTAAATATPAYFACSMAFCLNDIPSYADFVGLYDNYKIMGVTLRLTPVYSQSSQGSSSSTSTPGCLIHYINDYDDNGVPTASEAGIDVLRQYPGFKTLNMATGRTTKIYIKPRMNIPSTVAAGTFTGSVSQRSGWCDCNSIDIVHYGAKFILEMYQLNANVNYFPIKVEATYYLAFKGIR